MTLLLTWFIISVDSFLMSFNNSSTQHDVNFVIYGHSWSKMEDKTTMCLDPDILDPLVQIWSLLVP